MLYITVLSLSLVVYGADVDETLSQLLMKADQLSTQLTAINKKMDLENSAMLYKLNDVESLVKQQSKESCKATPQESVPQIEDGKLKIMERYEVRSDTTLEDVDIDCSVGSTCMRIWKGVTLTIRSSRITTTSQGRFLYMSQGSNLQLEFVNIVGFHASGKEEDGGVVLAEEGNHTISISNSEISYNRAGRGGSVLRSNDSNVQIIDTRFHNNTCDMGTSVIMAMRCNVTIINSKFSSNTGAVTVAWGQLTLSSVTFIGNSVLGSGGALAIYDAQATITSCNFTNNKAETDMRVPGVQGGGSGGAIWVGMNDAQVVIKGNTVFSGNSASADRAVGGGTSIRCYQIGNEPKIIIQIVSPTYVPTSDIANDDCQLRT